MNNDTPLPLDPWLASSLLQKAIRRGATDHALRGGHEFHRHRGQAIWRRLALIAFEDIGIGHLALVKRVTMMAADPDYRHSFGSEQKLLSKVIIGMAAAPKDRSADYLICTAHDGHDLDGFREECRGRSGLELAALATEPFVPLEKRAVAAWCAVSTGDGVKFSLGEPLMELLDAFTSSGLRSDLVETVLVGVRLMLGVGIALSWPWTAGWPMPRSPAVLCFVPLAVMVTSAQVGSLAKRSRWW